MAGSSLDPADGKRLDHATVFNQRYFTTRELPNLPLRIHIGDITHTISDLGAWRDFVYEWVADQSWPECNFMSCRLIDEPRPNRCRH